ncbi:hypothetical protein BUALT_Bualt19G0034900 [Buddleja alternifolia]|uniref:Uncharacterized protein n=1 Tax=Buddleja alternifolia TaxID=168488 RepID=A0AAV6W8I4_9LAMI|nr:hypothetical protein BUALT_Bualt19G0034900 [Buddleja alternifolia]
MEKIHDNSSNDDEGYSLTPTSLLLVEDHPLSMKPLVLLQLDPIIMDPWHHLSRWFKSNDDRTAFHTANNGMSFWEKKQHNPSTFAKAIADAFPKINVLCLILQRLLWD